MGKYKEAFLRSLNSERESEESFVFGPPATEADLAALESTSAAKLPQDLRELLSEFNGIKTADGEVYFFNTTEMPKAAEYYRDWDWPTDLLLECSANILYVCQENGMASMWGVVIRPFASFEYGQIIAFDHDEIAFAEEAGELFMVPYDSLVELVEAEYKRAELP